MTQLSKVAKVLRRNTRLPGVTASQIARQTGLSRDAIYRRVYDLRVNEGKTIYSNIRNVNGTRKMYYRMAG